jgi:hypothetical protein
LFLPTVDINAGVVLGDGCVCPVEDFDTWIDNFGCMQSGHEMYRQVSISLKVYLRDKRK